MKKTVFLMLLLFNLTAVCQQTTKETKKFSLFRQPTTTGNQIYDELLKFEAKHSTGVCLNVMGLGLLVAGLNQNRKPIAYAGAILTGISTVVIFTSHSHIKKAELMMNENGIGLKVKL